MDKKITFSSGEGLSDLSEDELKHLKLTLECRFLQRDLEQLTQKETFTRSLLTQIKSKFFTVVIPIIVVLLTFLSTMLVDTFRSSAVESLKQEQAFDSIARALGDFTYSTEMLIEWYETNRTSLEELRPVIDKYNQGIITLRGGEVIYRAKISKYWGEDSAMRFDSLMADIKRVDEATHGLNEETGKVLRKVQVRADAKIALEVAQRISERMSRLEWRTDSLVSELASKI